MFKDVKAVDVIGTSKGRGITGVMKRHNFHGLRASHGVKKGSPQRGSIGSQRQQPRQRPAQEGHPHGRPATATRRVTVRNLSVVRIDAENNLMLVEGAVPGPNGGLVMVRPTNKRG